MESEISVEGELTENVLRELKDKFLEKVSYMTVDKASPSNVLKQIDIEEELESIKKEIAKALLDSNSTQRMYFVIRSLIMTILGAIITLAVFWQLGTINVIEDFMLGISIYGICLILSRLFDTRIVNFSKNIFNEPLRLNLSGSCTRYFTLR